MVFHLAKMVPSIDVFLQLSVIQDRKALEKEGHLGRYTFTLKMYL